MMSFLISGEGTPPKIGREVGAMNLSESPSTALRAPSPPLEEKDEMRGYGSLVDQSLTWRVSFHNRITGWDRLFSCPRTLTLAVVNMKNTPGTGSSSSRSE